MNVLGGFERMMSDFGGLKGGSSSSRFCFNKVIKKHTQLWGLPRTGGSIPAMGFPGVVPEHVPGTLGEHGMFPVPCCLFPVPVRVPPVRSRSHTFYF